MPYLWLHILHGLFQRISYVEFPRQSSTCLPEMKKKIDQNDAVPMILHDLDDIANVSMSRPIFFVSLHQKHN